MAAIKAQPKGPVHAVKEIFSAIKEMPKPLWQLASVYLFQWYALFIYWQYISHSLVKFVWDSTSADKVAYQEAVAWTGLVNGFYNVVTFISAFGLMWMVRKYAAKYVHAFAVTLAALAFAHHSAHRQQIPDVCPDDRFRCRLGKYDGVPFMIVVGSIPKERYGVYMGIVNMMIVIPMLIETVSFGWVYKTFLGSNPANAMTFAGVFLAIAAALTLTIKTAAKPATTE